ncbi:MAG: hypothetical protein OCD02_13300 [Spirochaetaceae bacterium]
MAKQFKVETIKAGLFTATLEAESLEKTIEKMSAEGWDFKNCQDVVGRRCGCVPYPIVWAIFEKG